MLNLKERRIELGLTMLDVAKAVGVSEATISRYESGNIKNMRRDRIEKYAQILKVNPVAIIGIDDPSVFESTEELASAPIDVIEALDGDPARIFEFMQAVDNDRAMEAVAHSKASKLLELFSKLNDLGQDRALEYVEDLTQVEKYTQ